MIRSYKSQSLSADIVIVVIIILFAGLFLVINQVNEEEGKELDVIYQEAQVQSGAIYDSFKRKSIIGQENEIDANRLLSLDYESLRQELNLKHDFAIVFEKNGTLVKIDAENNINCVGSDKIIVNGQPCR